MKSIAVILFLFLLSIVVADESLRGSKVFNVYPQTKKDRLILAGLELNIPGLDVWQKAHIEGREGKIFVPSRLLNVFETLLKFNSIQYEVFMDNPEEVLTMESFINDAARMRNPEGKISFTAYNRHTEINTYLDELASNYPGKVSVESAGRTPNGRELKYIKISTTNWADTRKPVIIVDGGIHAREWIAPSVALYMIRKLVEDITESDIVNNIDWLIVPLINPDGYEYSHTNSRLWRKTRSTASSATCPGTDGNRNFDYHWMESGSSNNPCSDIFAGSRPFSEMETDLLRVEMAKNKGRAKGYLAIHSYGSYILYPYGYDGSNPPNVAELRTLGQNMGKAIDDLKAPGARDYIIGNSAVALNYAAAGASDDYAMGVGGMTLSYTIELPGGGVTGFDPPPSRIMQTVTETWAGIVVFARYIINTY